MSTPFKKLLGAKRWHLLVDTALQALEEKGYRARKVPRKGRQNIWSIEQDGDEKLIAIRTSQDRWFAFPPLDGNHWKTLDDVDLVVVATVDDKDHPRKAEVYLFPADEVRRRFNEAFAARVEAGRTGMSDFGMWVALDIHETGGANDVGSGIIESYPPISIIPLEIDTPELTASSALATENSVISSHNAGQPNVQQALLKARREIATITGVPLDQIQLELRIGS